MQKLLKWLDKYLLQIGVMFLFAFIPLYPKLPLIDIWQTWIYIRWEDFFVATVILIWLIQLYRKKVICRSPLVWPILVYWLIGGISLFNAIFIAPRPPHFFPHLAVLHYFRRIEYMMLFFIVAGSIKSLAVVKRYLWVIFMSIILVCLYGFGQRFWGLPAFLTMNEEFSKGIPLHLPSTARITSTFAGHYDLAAYLVLTIAFGVSLIFAIRHWGAKIALFLITIASFFLLLLTASRISFFAYLLAISLVLFFQKKKWLIIPVILLSFYLMKQMGGGTAVRLGKTFRVERVVFDVKTGRPIATLKEFIAAPTPTPRPEDDQPLTETHPPSAGTGGEDLPLGTGFLALPGKKEPLPTKEPSQKVALKGVGPEEEPLILQLEKMKMATLSSEIATSSALFLLSEEDYFVKRAIVYDISFTTRFQGEWPRAWKAFKRNIVLGSGYSTISLATDNDYLRSLGETGILGFFSFWGSIMAIILLVRQILIRSQSIWLRGLAIAVFGGLAGLLLNATLIDVFEASKVAFTFWMFVGLLAGLAKLYPEFRRSLWQDATEVFSSHWLACLVLIVSAFIIFMPMLNNYFVADDFVWLKWAAFDNPDHFQDYFFDSEGFFYRPLAKTLFYFIQPIFHFQPQGYHLLSFVFHLISTITVYWLAMKLSQQKLIAFLTSFLFLLHPIHEESIYWISSFSTLMAATFYFLSFCFYLKSRQKEKRQGSAFWILAILFFGFSLCSHELGTTLPLVFLLYELVWQKKEDWKQRLLTFAPFIILAGIYFYVRYASGAHGLSGDYNYRLINLPFNFVGNFLGYFGELTFSFHFVPFYQKLRLILRTRKLLAVFVGLLGIGFLKPLFYQFKGRRWLIFSFGWMIITLLPFLGLGNMSERYAYLASFGYLFIVVNFLVRLYALIKVRKGVWRAIVVLVLITAFLVNFYIFELKRANQDWEEAGEISRTVQLALSSSFKEFPEETSLYFANVPVRHGLAWVFPVGLKEAILFIYRDETMKIYQFATLEEAWHKHEKTAGATWVFVYQDNELRKATK